MARSVRLHPAYDIIDDIQSAWMEDRMVKRARAKIIVDALARRGALSAGKWEQDLYCQIDGNVEINCTIAVPDAHALDMAQRKLNEINAAVSERQRVLEMLDQQMVVLRGALAHQMALVKSINRNLAEAIEKVT